MFVYRLSCCFFRLPLLVLCVVAGCQRPAPSLVQPPTPEVIVTKPSIQNLTNPLEFNGNAAAVETVDSCIGELVSAIEAAGGQMLLTSDHGNCEVMWDSKAQSPHTAHTTNLVPLILVNGNDGISLTNGRLADLAPSLLAMMGINQPARMTGKSLFTTI